MTGLANPAATYCVSVGGTYDLATGTCTISGIAYDAWSLYYASVSPSSTSTSSTDVILDMMSEFMMPMMMLMLMMGMMKPMVQGMAGATK